MASTFTAAEVRQAVSTAVITALAASEWSESTVPYDLFGTEWDSENISDRCYSVGCTSTTPTRGPQRGMVEVTTMVGVRYSVSIAALDQVAGYDSALDAEADLLKAIHTIHRSTWLHVIYTRSQRGAVADGWLLGELTFTCKHNLALV